MAFSNVTDTTVRFHFAELKTEQIIEGFWLAQDSIAILDFVLDLLLPITKPQKKKKQKNITELFSFTSSLLRLIDVHRVLMNV